MNVSRPGWRFSLLAVALLATALVAAAARSADATKVVLYKSAQCECCIRWASLLTDAGFDVEVRVTDDMAAVAAEHHVATELMSCHVALVDDYVIVGHVPIADIQRLLDERPSVAGIAVPGMPPGSPGMELPGVEPVHYDVLAFDRDGRTSVFARH